MHKLKVSLVVLGAAVLFSIDSYSSTCLAGRTFDKPKSIQEAKTADKDKVYREDEVDKQAQLSNADKLFKSFNSEFKCPDSGGKVAVTILLHKSGKVTDVKIDVSPNCSVTEKGRTILLRLKFTPATKSGAKVSEYMIIDIKRELVSSPGPS
jgi:nucleosome binding factor SPN SPT16 subunit